MRDGTESDEELARGAKLGDAAAFDALVRRYLRPAMALAWQYTRSVEDAEDVVQESFHRAVRALAEYDDERPFSAWFYTIVRNAGRSAVHKDSRRAALAPLTLLEDDVPSRSELELELVADLEQAIDALTPTQQACFRLCDVEGFTSVEAGRMLGVHEGTVRTHRHRARQKLRAAVNREEVEHG